MADNSINSYKLEINRNMLSETEQPVTDTLSYGFSQVKRNGEYVEEFADSLLYAGITYRLKEIKLEKEMFRPGHLRLLFEVKYETAFNIKESVESIFGLCTLNLSKVAPSSIKDSDGKVPSYYLASHYLVMNYSYKSGSDRANYELVIDAYSPDQLLTLNKRSDAYTGKKLYNDILTPIDETNKLYPSSFVKVFDKNCFQLKTNLHYLKYISIWKSGIGKKVEKEDGSNGYTSPDGTAYPSGIFGDNVPLEKEYINPYLVQYDESSYDFLARTLNRNGEYFYYEDGCLIVGWIEPRLLNTVMPDCGVEDVKYSLNDKMGEFVGDDSKLVYDKNFFVYAAYQNQVNGLGGIVIDKYESEFKRGIAFHTDDVGLFANSAPTEDINEKTQLADDYSLYSSYKDFAYYPAGFWITAVTEALAQPTLGAMASSLLFDTGGRTASANSLSNLMNDDVYRSCFHDQELDEHGNTIDNTRKYKGIYFDERYSETDDKREVLALYSTNRAVVESDLFAPLFEYQEPVEEGSTETETKYYSIGSNYYERIGRAIKAEEEGRICLNLGSLYYDQLLLGSLCTVGDKDYIVVSISDEVHSVNVPSTQTGDGGSGNGGSSDGGSTGESSSSTSQGSSGSQEKDNWNLSQVCKVELIPYKVKINPSATDEEGGVFPPRGKGVDFVRKASSQKAVVTSSIDPQHRSRITVKFPWQSECNNAFTSPWLSVAWPMASSDAGFHMLPNKGDVAIVNYVNGNVECPYVEGFVYDDKHNALEVRQGEATKCIASTNGHSIMFSDPPCSSDFLANLIAPWKFINQFTPYASFDMGEDSKSLVGGITLSDKNKIYSISMSSDQRLISINSALGKVSISAYDGITISAPNGNVNIEGKNVSISAGNNLTLKSGTNVPNPDNGGYWARTDQKKRNIFRNLGLSLFSSFFENFLDLSFIRTIFETFFRPIGGELLIRSNRNLYLEAGYHSILKPYEEFDATTTNMSVIVMKCNLEAVRDVFKEQMREAEANLNAINKRFKALLAAYIAINYFCRQLGIERGREEGQVAEIQNLNAASEKTFLTNLSVGDENKIRMLTIEEIIDADTQGEKDAKTRRNLPKYVVNFNIDEYNKRLDELKKAVFQWERPNDGGIIYRDDNNNEYPRKYTYKYYDNAMWRGMGLKLTELYDNNNIAYGDLVDAPEGEEDDDARIIREENNAKIQASSADRQNYEGQVRTFLFGGAGQNYGDVWKYFVEARTDAELGYIVGKLKPLTIDSLRYMMLNLLNSMDPQANEGLRKVIHKSNKTNAAFRLPGKEDEIFKKGGKWAAFIKEYIGTQHVFTNSDTYKDAFLESIGWDKSVKDELIIHKNDDGKPVLKGETDLKGELLLTNKQGDTLSFEGTQLTEKRKNTGDFTGKRSDLGDFFIDLKL